MITSSTKPKVRPELAPLLKPSSIIERKATGRLRVAADEQASASSQARNRPECRRTNGHSARSEPMGALGAGLGEVMPDMVAAWCRDRASRFELVQLRGQHGLGIAAPELGQAGLGV